MTVAGVTVCVSCNINVSVRIASPGDTGDVVQQIAAAAQATVAGIQSAAAATAAEAAPAAIAATPIPASTDVPLNVEPVLPDPVGDPVPVVPSVAAVALTASGEDPPRHGASPLDGSPRHLLAPERGSTTAAAAPDRGGTAEAAAPAVLVLERAAPTAAVRARPDRDRTGAAPRAPRPPAAPTSPVPSPPAPALLAAAPLGGHGGAGSANAALTTMTLAGLTLVFLSRIRSIARSIRRAGPVTQPHPPG